MSGDNRRRDRNNIPERTLFNRPAGIPQVALPYGEPVGYNTDSGYDNPTKRPYFPFENNFDNGCVSTYA